MSVISITELVKQANEAEDLLNKTKVITLSNGNELEIIRLPEEIVLDLMERIQKKGVEISKSFKESNKYSCEFIYEAVRLAGGLSLKSKEVQDAFGISPKDTDKIYKIVKKVIPEFEDRGKVLDEILSFSELSSLFEKEDTEEEGKAAQKLAESKKK